VGHERGIVSSVGEKGRVNNSERQSSWDAATSSADSEFLLRLQLESNPEALCVVRAAMQRAAQLVDFPENDGRAIVRAVDEALTNIIRHAYQGRKGMGIEVSCRRLWKGNDNKTPAGLEIILEDSGAPLDSAKLKKRVLEEVRPGGLGLHFIHSSMDVVEFSHKDGKNFLRLVKYLGSSQPTKGPEGE
jgi:serine/threonine-protein kinase RsbW